MVEVEGFQGIPCITEYEAQENVSEMAISHFVSKMNVTINDVNHAPFLETYRQLHHYMSWSMILQMKHETLHIEKNRLFSAHMELLKRLSSICIRYGDILPLVPCASPPQPASKPMEPVILYTGLKPPKTLHELLACELFNIVQENTANGCPITD